MTLLCTHYRCPRSRGLPFQPPTLFFHPMLILLRRHFRCLPFPHQINAHMLPPPHPHSCSILPLCCLAEFQKRLRRNVMRNRIMTFPDVCLHSLKPRLFSHRLRQVVLPLNVSLPPREPPCHSPRHMVLGPP